VPYADLLIRNGRLVDGSGAPERTCDVAITDRRVSAIGIGLPFDAEQTIDATGNIVAPGFVDIHSHGDLVLAWPSDKRLELIAGRLAQGITTEVIGNCGLGASPLFGHGPELLPSINGWMAPAAFAWEWSDLGGYFAHLDRLGLPLNVAALVPHGALRLGAHHLAVGETDSNARAVMTAKLDQAVDQGAFGLSAGLIYPPGMYTSTTELIDLARCLRESDGVFTCHIRGSSETLLPAVEELLTIGREAGVRVHHSHAEAVGRRHWNKLSAFLEMEDRARVAGVRVSADMFPYPVAATMMLAIYPPWSLEGGLSRLVSRLKDPQTRARIRRDIETLTPTWPPWHEGGWPHNLVMAVGWERILVSTVGSETNREVEGMSLEELGASRGVHPFDAVSDLMVEENGNVGQFVLDISGEDGLRELARRSDIAFVTDANDYGKGKPHPAAYGSFPKVLGQFVREDGLLSLPEAIRRMTSLPADTIGIRDRGRLVEGAFADVVIFDLETVCDRATLREPRKPALGIETVLVNGEAVFHRGGGTGALPGAIVRR
jgi:N-acyl-D-aspartate/D-glutamate deacylase